MVIGRDGFKKIEILGTSGKPIVSASEIVIDAGRMILKGNNFKLIPHQMEVDGVAYMADGIVPFKALVTLSTNQQVNLEVLGASSKEDRRASLKVPTDAVEMVLEVRSTGSSNSHYMNVEDEIQLLNLSMNGVGFMSNRPYFKGLRELKDKINALNIPNVHMDQLSMGMTGDYEVAIEEGATFVRVGTGIFGERNYAI